MTVLTQTYEGADLIIPKKLIEAMGIRRIGLAFNPLSGVFVIADDFLCFYKLILTAQAGF